MFKRKAKRQKEILESYSKLKKEVYNFDIIKRYATSIAGKDDSFQITDATYKDLDFDELFMFIDRSVSKIGQQYLYKAFQSIPKDAAPTTTRELLIEKLRKNETAKHECILALANLSDYEVQYLTTLFLEDQIQKPSWFWLIRLSGALSLVTFIGAFFFPVLWIAMVFILLFNFIIHYWNKKNLYQYAASLPQLITLVQTARNISAYLEDKGEVTKQAIKDIDKLKPLIALFKFNPAPKSDFGEVADYILEIVKALFLIEPLLLFRILNRLEHQKDNIHHLFTYVGELDLCLTINSIRETSKVHCKLNRLKRGNSLKMVKGYHPLITDPVNNTISVEEKSILLTGSNMSGKSTFIRTLGINAILGQSLNLCFAESFEMPKMHVSSAIRIADDLMTDSSYYFQEVTAIKKLMVASDEENANLFLLDELFKGTNTLERIASGKAVLSRLAQKENLVFIASHDLELSELLKDEFITYHFSEQIQDGRIIFDYKLKEGSLQKTNAIKILQVNGFPTEVIEEAKRIVEKLKN